MSMIEEYIDLAIELEKINRAGLSTKKDVKQNNRLADQLRYIAKTIEAHNPELKDGFSNLLFHNNFNVRIWCAHHMLEVMTYKSEQRRCALQEIIARSVDNYGEKMWLDQWYTNNPQDKLQL